MSDCACLPACLHWVASRWPCKMHCMSQPGCNQAWAATPPAGVTKNEMLLWHQQYLACCAELNQWDTVVEYAKVTDNCPLQIDAMVHLHDWQNLKAVSRGRVQQGCMAGLLVRARTHRLCAAAVARRAGLVACGCCYSGMLPHAQMVLPKAQIEDNASATIVRAQMHLQELQVVDVDRICKQVTGGTSCASAWMAWMDGAVLRRGCLVRRMCMLACPQPLLDVRPGPAGNAPVCPAVVEYA